MSKKRELDLITPSFDLTDEQIEDLRRIATDPEYVREVDKRREAYAKQQLEKLKQMILTGKSESGYRLPPYFVNELKAEYKSMTGEEL